MRFFILILALQFMGTGAMAGEKKKAAANPTREKIISREAGSKSGDKSRVSFDDADIGGARKTPMASMLNNTKANKNYDMVPIRTDWRPEMVQSAASLDAGRSR